VGAAAWYGAEAAGLGAEARGSERRRRRAPRWVSERSKKKGSVERICKEEFFVEEDAQLHREHGYCLPAAISKGAAHRGAEEEGEQVDDFELNLERHLRRRATRGGLCGGGGGAGREQAQGAAAPSGRFCCFLLSLSRLLLRWRCTPTLMASLSTWRRMGRHR
jgi:hypothetical protein